MLSNHGPTLENNKSSKEFSPRNDTMSEAEETKPIDAKPIGIHWLDVWKDYQYCFFYCFLEKKNCQFIYLFNTCIRQRESTFLIAHNPSDERSLLDLKKKVTPWLFSVKASEIAAKLQLCTLPLVKHFTFKRFDIAARKRLKLVLDKLHSSYASLQLFCMREAYGFFVKKKQKMKKKVLLIVWVRRFFSLNW